MNVALAHCRAAGPTPANSRDIVFDIRDDTSTPEGVRAVLQDMYADGIRVFSAPLALDATTNAVSALEEVVVADDPFVLVSGVGSTSF
ncbi:MAG: hypothetical protein EOO65_04805 [Methanosarcinales archaeon]|nr:MAG: hypothetical protein EOO65_04805 [Methanosarcinales archaeon]